MINITYKTLILLTINLFLFSCEKDIELKNPNQERKNVVNAILTVDSTMEVILYKSNLPLSSDGSFEIVKGAIVEIYENDLAEVLSFSGGNIIAYGDAEGQYSSNKIVEAKKTYKLKVSGENITELSSSITIPSNPQVLNPKITPTSDGQDLTLTINDPVGEENFYELTLNYTYINIVYNNIDTLFDGPYTEQAYLMEKTAEGNPFAEEGNSGELYIFSDELFNGKNYTINLEVHTSLQYRDHYENPDDPTQYSAIITGSTLQVTTINKELYEYNLSIREQFYTQGDPFSEAVQVKSNIKNGLGVFGARNISFFPVEL